MRILCIIFLIFLSACSDESVTHFNGQAMTMHYHVMIGSTSEEDNVQYTIDDTFFQVNKIYNHFNPNSELSKLNDLKKNQKVEISDELRVLLELTDNMFEITQGKFDPTVHSVQGIWKEHLSRNEFPPPKKIEPLNQAVGWHHIHLSENTFWKDDTLAKLDLSGIAKGHAIDLLVERLNTMGYENVYVEWGGEIAASGKHPSGRNWNIAVTSFNDEELVETVSLDNQAVASSGDYLQYWKVESETYCHIIDPETKMPLRREKGCLASATVVAPTCALADGLATAAMLVDDPESWAKSLRDQDSSLSFWFFKREDD